MPERGFNTEFWADSFIQQLPQEARYLYIYLWTNEHCNQAGLYEITLRQIAFETELPKEKLPELLQMLEPKVRWYKEHDLIWVKNFLKRQSKSPKFLTAAAKCLNSIHHNGAIKEFLDYNLEKYSISIPYRYSIDTVSIPSVSSSGAVSSSSASAKAEKGCGGEDILAKKTTSPQKLADQMPKRTRAKPKQQEAGVFLDKVEQYIGVKLVQRAKLQGAVRPVFVKFPDTTPEKLLECFKWLKSNDPFCRSRDSPATIMSLPAKYPEWAAGKLPAYGGKEERHGEHRQDAGAYEPPKWEEAPESDDTS